MFSGKIIKVISIVFFTLSVSLFFAYDAAAFIYDDFDNRAQTNEYWVFENEDAIANYNEIAGLIEINSATAHKEFELGSLYSFSGDFDVVMRYQDWNLNAAAIETEEDLDPVNVGIIAMPLEDFYAMESDQEPQNFIYTMRMWDYSTGGDFYCSMGYFDSVEAECGIGFTDDTAGMLRMIRAEDDIYAYYYDHNISDWVGLWNYENKFSDPVVIGTMAYSGGGELLPGGFQVNMDFVAISSDGMAPIPEPGTIALVLTGLLGITFVRKYKK